MRDPDGKLETYGEKISACLGALDHFSKKSVGHAIHAGWKDSNTLGSQAADLTDARGIGLKEGVPQAMELRDSFGQTSWPSFANFKKNPPLEPGSFTFVIPKGADVFNNRATGHSARGRCAHRFVVFKV